MWTAGQYEIPVRIFRYGILRYLEYIQLTWILYVSMAVRAKETFQEVVCNICLILFVCLKVCIFIYLSCRCSYSRDQISHGIHEHIRYCRIIDQRLNSSASIRNHYIIDIESEFHSQASEESVQIRIVSRVVINWGDTCVH